MAQRRYLIAGAKGGQGTTTVATVVAALAAGHTSQSTGMHLRSEGG